MFHRFYRSRRLLSDKYDTDLPKQKKLYSLHTSKTLNPLRKNIN